ncbi:MAG TPA: hypothetical protein VKY74_13160 [Chloroflexia bacterium]|nr:hypothetical protein [Chloroflexia bacterium]
MGNGSTAAPATGSAPDDWRDAISAATRRVLLRYEKPLKHTTPAQQAEYIRKLRDGLAAIEARP